MGSLVMTGEEERAFRRFLRRGGRSPAATDRCLARVREFLDWMADRYSATAIPRPEDVSAFVAEVEARPRASARGHLWALAYFFEFRGDDELRELSKLMRAARTKRRPLPIRAFEAIEPAVIDRLAGAGVDTVDDLLVAGGDGAGRAALAESTQLPVRVVEKLVKMADLTRIPGIAGTRAALYYDAGVDTIEQLARWDPDALRVRMVDFVVRSGFPGIAPTPAETRFTVETAKHIERLVEL